MRTNNASTPSPASPVPDPPNPLKPAKRITAVEAVDAICGVVRDRLMRQDAFRRSNTAYLGIKISYALKVEMFSLGESGLEMTGVADIGESTKTSERLTVSDTLVAGRVNQQPATASMETVAVKESASETAG